MYALEFYFIFWFQFEKIYALAATRTVLLLFPERLDKMLACFDDPIIRVCQIPKGPIANAFSLFITRTSYDFDAMIVFSHYGLRNQ